MKVRKLLKEEEISVVINLRDEDHEMVGQAWFLRQPFFASPLSEVNSLGEIEDLWVLASDEISDIGV